MEILGQNILKKVVTKKFGGNVKRIEIMSGRQLLIQERLGTEVVHFVQEIKLVKKIV